MLTRNGVSRGSAASIRSSLVDILGEAYAASGVIRITSSMRTTLVLSYALPEPKQLFWPESDKFRLWGRAPKSTKLFFLFGSVMAAAYGLGTDPPAFGTPGSAAGVVVFLMLDHP